MTRETKVGLLVGMALILLIGIIVSDLLVEPATTAPPALQRFAGEVEQEMASYSAPTPRWPSPSAAPASPRLRPVPQPDELPDAASPQTQPPLAAGRIESTPQRVITFDRPDVSARVAAEASASPGPREADIPRLDLPGGAAPVAAATPAAVAGTVTVRSGDTLYAIAQRALGDGDRWRELYDANRDQLKSPNLVQAGMNLRVPGRTPAAAPQRPGSDTTAIYVVQAGDTLYRIAARRLGDGKRWREIYEANRSTIGSDPAQLEAGMKLAMPRS